MTNTNTEQKTLDTLLKDIYSLFDEGVSKEIPHKINEDNFNTLVKSLRESLEKRLERPEGHHDTDPAYKIRMSNIGTKNRKAWFDSRVEQDEFKNQISPVDHFKFVYGDIIEALFLFLAKEAGHEVKGEQGELEISGILGHRDCIIDGVTCDIKSASSFGFKKFKEGTIFNDDPFGYIPQISAYAKEGCRIGDTETEEGALIAVNKESGEMVVLKVHPIDMINPYARIEELKEVITMNEPPAQKCYSPVPDGQSGNMALSKNCEYCSHKFKCWDNLRGFQYASGVKHLTTVVSTPRVPEVTSDL